MQDLEVHALSQVLDLQEKFPGDPSDALVDLDLAELRSAIAGAVEEAVMMDRDGFVLQN